MAQLMEVLGKGLVGDLWCIFADRLEPFHTNIDGLSVRLAERPNDPELRLAAAVTCYRAGRYIQAQDHLDKLDRQDPTTRFDAAVTTACVLDALGQRGQAIDVLDRENAQLDEPSGPLLFAIASLCETVDRIDDAMEYYTRAIDVLPNLCNARQRLAAIHAARGQLDRAIEQYEQLTKIDPGDTEARMLLASMLLNDGQGRKAVAEYQIALTVEPDNWTTQNHLVKAFVKAGQYEQAIEVLEDLLVKQGEFPDLYLQLAELEMKLGHDDQATEHYRQAVQVHPNYLEAVVKFGTHHLQRGRYIDAAEQFSRAVEINDRLLNAYVGLAVAQRHAGWHDRAQETIDLACAVEPNSTMLFAEIAKLELKASAVEQAKQYLDGHPESKDTGQELLRIQSQRFAEAIETHPDRADWHYRHGLLLKAQGHLAGATAEFERAVEINPNYVKALVKLALALHEMGDSDRGRLVLERAVVLEPGYADIYYQLGLIYADQNRYRLAVEQFEQSLKRGGNNVQTHWALAAALEDIGLTDRARASWKAIIELAPNSEQAKIAAAALGGPVEN